MDSIIRHDALIIPWSWSETGIVLLVIVLLVIVLLRSRANPYVDDRRERAKEQRALTDEIAAIRANLDNIATLQGVKQVIQHDPRRARLLQRKLRQLMVEVANDKDDPGPDSHH